MPTHAGTRRGRYFYTQTEMGFVNTPVNVGTPVTGNVIDLFDASLLTIYVRVTGALAGATVAWVLFMSDNLGNLNPTNHGMRPSSGAIAVGAATVESPYTFGWPSSQITTGAVGGGMNAVLSRYVQLQAVAGTANLTAVWVSAWAQE